VDNQYWDSRHISVLLNELVNSIEIFKDRQNIIVDTTLWMAWHAIEIIKKMWKEDIFIWFDADDRNLVLAEANIKKQKPKAKIILINSNFINLKEELKKVWIEEITWIYYDLGLSSLHLDEAERWFSFMREWPLDMRLDNNHWKTAKEIINSYNASELREIFMKYWESSQANKVSHKIVEQRKQKKFETTFDLADIIAGWPKEKSKIFQALRIETNKELEAMEKSIPDAIQLLKKDWNIFIISFHSLEDRITKNILRKETKDCICSDIICSCHHKKSLKLHSKKPILPSSEEIEYNPRSRSAKARWATKII
jgi:16S rRNA (cytosine1402-N4)-methyltransferase